MSSPFQERIQKLQAATEEGERKFMSKDRSVPTTVIIGAVIPFIFLIFFFVVQPSIVQKKEGNTYVRDSKKIFYWTIGSTLAVWLGLYIWTYCQGYKPSSFKI